MKGRERKCRNRKEIKKKRKIRKRKGGEKKTQKIWKN